MRSAWQICSVSSAGSRLWCRFRRAVSTLGGRLECRAAGSRLPGFWGQAGFAAGVCMLDSFVCLCLCLCPSLSLSLSASASVSASASDSETDCAYVPAGDCYIDCHKTTVCVCARARARKCVCVCVCVCARARACVYDRWRGGREKAKWRRRRRACSPNFDCAHGTSESVAIGALSVRTTLSADS